jgi:hypothetical protein
MVTITMRRVLASVAGLALSAAALLAAQTPRPSVEVYKDPGCGCCAKWVEHLQANGFTVKTTDRADLSELKAKHRVPQKVQSCHMALVDGYVVEGHVPAQDVKRLLKERPAVVGIAVPGMPIGSPGMEVAGMKMQPFDVLAFDKAGQTRVFSSHGK